MTVFEKRNSLLGMEFDPNNAQVILLLEGADEFNEWSMRIGKEQAESGQPIVYVTIKKLGPAHSRIQELSLVTG